VQNKWSDKVGLKTICPLCGNKYFGFAGRRCPNCDDIDFKKIQEVSIVDAEMTHRIETEEEFDLIMSTYLTELDGWQHYETKTIEYEVPDGYELTFLIIYEGGRREFRKYHSSSPHTLKLIQHVNFSEDGWDVL
jgi:hypothetical protein